MFYVFASNHWVYKYEFQHRFERVAMLHNGNAGRAYRSSTVFVVLGSSPGVVTYFAPSIASSLIVLKLAMCKHNETILKKILQVLI